MNNSQYLYIPRLFAEFPLPRIDVSPERGAQFNRHRGPGVLTYYRLATHESIVPYGPTARLLLAWLCTHAYVWLDYEPVFDRPQIAVVRELTASRGVSEQHICEQMGWMMDLLIAIEKLRIRRNWHIQAIRHLTVVKRVRRWPTRGPDRRRDGMQRMEMKLLDLFVREIKTRSLRVDRDVYVGLQHAPLAMDLYTWLLLKLEELRERSKPSARVPWHIVAMQLGQGDDDVPEEAEDFVD